ncbi:unnamed protein product [Ilex paraguariensis]|uniref:Uncharacterized protein n=1 Tax=Ilex paraguariensis TaxID=185542 RepID=A0ABC8SDB9_9AQUA
MAPPILYRVILLLLLSDIIASRSIVKTLPGYPTDLPFELETGYVGVGEKDDVQLFYYFVESERSPKDDPLILWLAGGPGCSALRAFFYEIGPFTFNYEESTGNKTTLELNPYSWTKVASIIYIDQPVGTGFSYANTSESYISSDTISATQTYEFLRKWLVDHPKYLNNPLYICGVSYIGMVIPIIVQEIYNGNEAGNKPQMNIKGYMLGNPLTDKNRDVNSRIKYAHHVALLSDDLYKSTKANCNGEYIDVDPNNGLCSSNMQLVNKCLEKINLPQILEPLCSTVNVKSNLLRWDRSSVEENSMDLLWPLHQATGPWWPFTFNYEESTGNKTTLELNPYSWTKVASIIYIDQPVGTGFSYANTSESYISSDTISATQTYEFLRKWLVDHPKYLNNPLYICGVSYIGMVIPIIVQEIYNGNEAGNKPQMNIKGYMLGNPLTDKNRDVNSRIKYAHHVALLSDDLYKSTKANCNGEYIDVDPNNGLCSSNMQLVNKCLEKINLPQILEPLCSTVNVKSNLLRWDRSSVEENSMDLLWPLHQATGPWCRWLVDHPKYLNNPLYICGVSYIGMVIPIIVQEIYNGNEAGNKPQMNIKGYMLGNPLTDKNRDVNSRIKYAHHVALLSDDLYKSTKANCNGEYIDVDPNNGLCSSNMQLVNKCLEKINLPQILEPLCSTVNVKSNLLRWDRSSVEENSMDLLWPLHQATGPWCRVASIIYIDQPVGTGFSYANTSESYISSDTISATQTYEFLRKWLVDHPKYLNNPLYICGVSYIGMVIPIIVQEIYNGNEAGNKPQMNIKGYMLGNPLTDKNRDVNSRIKYAHHVALLSDDLYKSTKANCNGEYIDVDPNNGLCSSNMQLVNKCLEKINLPQILEPLCSTVNVKSNLLRWDRSSVEENSMDLLWPLHQATGPWCREIYNGNEAGNKPQMNIKGYMLGNPLTDKNRDVNSRIKYAHHVALLSDDLYKSTKANCNGEYIDVDPNNGLCSSNMQLVNKCLEKINLPQILEPLCSTVNVKSNLLRWDRSSVEENSMDLLWPLHQATGPWCRGFNYVYATKWANDKDVQKALNIREGIKAEWIQCNASIEYSFGQSATVAYTFNVPSTVGYHRNLTHKNCRALIFSGDLDMRVPHLSTEKWIDSLNLDIESDWEPWFVDGQIAGYTMSYTRNDYSLTYATMKGAGHTVPEYKPRESLAMVDRWFAYYPL